MEKKEEEESEEKEKAKTRQGRSGVVIPDFKLNEVGDRDLSVYLCVFLCLRQCICICSTVSHLASIHLDLISSRCDGRSVRSLKRVF